MDYVAERNPVAALEQDEAVIRQTARLADVPRLGVVPGDENIRILVIAGTPFIVAYRVKRARIEIFRFIHSARKRRLR
ncbi:type II toxin-antitoxin system RelE/ParE family toxin [Enterobacillus tribolii]|nr:type II toxin-antitoxin system RelE/ParE family toxin [Enterobacillus tribolii]